MNHPIKTKRVHHLLSPFTLFLIFLTSRPYTNEDQIVFFIKDNGVGFDDQYKDKLIKVARY